MRRQFFKCRLIYAKRQELALGAKWFVRSASIYLSSLILFLHSPTQTQYQRIPLQARGPSYGSHNSTGVVPFWSTYGTALPGAVSKATPPPFLLVLSPRLAAPTSLYCSYDGSNVVMTQTRGSSNCVRYGGFCARNHTSPDHDVLPLRQSFQPLPGPADAWREWCWFLPRLVSGEKPNPAKTSRSESRHYSSSVFFSYTGVQK